MEYLQKVLCTLLIIFIAGVSLPVQAMTPLDVAIVPIINTADYKYVNDMQITQDKIREPFKYPFLSVE